MTTYDTGNPIGSTAAKDLYDNAQNFDLLLLGPLRSYPDRLGVQRSSWAGFQQQFDDFLLNSGFVFTTPSTYAAGITLNERNEVFAKEGAYYSAGPSLTLPYTTTGNWAVEGPLFTLRDDAIFRSQLANTADPAQGAALIGNVSQIVANITGLKALNKTSPSRFAKTMGYTSVNDGGDGFYFYDATDTASADNGATVIVATDGGRWKLNMPNGEISVLQCGADKTGAVDAAPAFQRAADATKKIRVPFGRYQLNSTINLRGGTYIEGDGREGTILQRTTNQGHTFQIGTSADHAGNCRISGLWFYKPQSYVSGSTTAIDWPVTSTSSHVQLYAGQDCDICDNFFWGMPYGIFYQDTSLLRIQRNNFIGMWDTQILGLQEGRAAIYGAQGLGYSVLVDISYNHISGGFFALNRTKTIGTVTYTTNEQIGPLLGIYSETCEGLNIHHNYLGGHSQYCIAFANINVSAQHKITDNFFDGGRDGTIKFLSGTNPAYTVVDFHICRNGFNGQQVSPEAISFNFTGSVRSAVTGIIADNIFENHLACPVNIDGVSGVKVHSNKFQAYHNRGGGAGSPGFSSGLFIGPHCLSVISTDNDYGGGTNDPQGANNCQWGEYWVSGATGYTGLFRPNGAGLGLAGGALCAGNTGSYPV